MKDVLVGLFFEGRHGSWERFSDYDLHDLGAAPAVGDHIVYPGVPTGLDRDVAANRTVYEVVRRYFEPSDDPKHPAKIALCVQGRPGTEDEMDILGP